MQLVLNLFKVEYWIALLYFFYSFTYIGIKNITKQLQSACKSVFIVNTLNKESRFNSNKVIRKNVTH